VLVEGTVIDTATGTKQDEQAARFPNGVPAVSDESMSAWMEYVYMQKPRPDAVGVNVTITVLDPNNNVYDVGTTTCDSDGFYKMSFTPAVPGEYTIYATFKGSDSYWPSYDLTAINVEEATTTPPPTSTPASIADMYLLPATIGIIITIIVATIVIVLIIRRK
jgi:hypothetical protein